ncbi:MAG: 2Fe-2S iron-sulfur cluster-binding protein [Ginsengibacter sp.]
MEKSHDDNNNVEDFSYSTRREFLTQVSAISTGLALTTSLKAAGLPKDGKYFSEKGAMNVTLIVNGKRSTLEIDPRVTLLDALREQIHLTGTKKGCDRGQCGACTVLVDGVRIKSCLTLAGMCDNKKITTVEGLAKGSKLHPMQAAFLKHDAFQCGYCTSGQLCSAVGLLSEGHAKTDEEIRELMSGNICRCGAYANILDAIKEVQSA